MSASAIAMTGASNAQGVAYAPPSPIVKNATAITAMMTMTAMRGRRIFFAFIKASKK